ncbi:MAG TPA: MFS transporter, partial [Nitrospiraceae bacterium]|nr:MFS transporter [Nitrospiraceae bacterium]
MADNEKAMIGRAGSGWGLLKTRNFCLLFSGQAISQIGDSMNKVALLWFVYELTGSAFKMTVIGLLQTIPPLVFGPLIGVYLDRMKKKPVMIWVDTIRTGLVTLIPLLYAMDMLTLERLYVLVFAISIVSTIFGPALASSVPLMVSRTQLTAANALIQGTVNIGLLVGPAVGGLGIAMMGAQNVLYLNAGTFLISVLCLIPIRLRETQGGSGRLECGGAIIHDLLVGFRFVFFQHRTVLLLMLTATLYSLGASAFVFILPVFAKELLDASPVELGWLWSSLGIGMLAASAWLAWINQGDFRKRLRLISAALAVGAVAVCTLGMLQAPVMAAVLIVVFGGSTAVFTPVVWAMLQELTPEPLLGRVFTTFSTGAMASAMAGMAGFGWAADA